MSMTPVVTFFNSRAGVGKASLVYHLAWMYAHLGTRVLVADLDPQANLTARLFDEEAIERLWDRETPATVFDPIAQMVGHEGELGTPHVEPVARNLSALIGTPRLATLEDELAESWFACLDGQPASFEVISAISNLLQAGAEQVEAEVILVDVGPSLGAINRTVLVASDHVILPLGADLFSLAGMEDLGKWLRDTRTQWTLRRDRAGTLAVPPGNMRAAGYIVSQHAMQSGRPAKAYERWMGQIPGTYAHCVLGGNPTTNNPAEDLNCLGIVKHFRSLMPLAQEARKPIFQLRAADGALGSHIAAAQQAYVDFQQLAERIASATWRASPSV